MADTASKHIDMTTGSLWRNIPLFAFPVAATSILEQLSNLIATVIIGNFSGDQGTLAMAAVGSNVPLTSLMLNLFIGMSLGSNVVIATAIGRNEQNMVKRAVPTSILMALVGFVVIALGEIFAEPMLAALNVPAETMPLASLYLRVFLLSMPSILLYNFEAAIFRSVGITRMPLQALAVSTVLNIGLDLIFVPILHWGVAGAAIATVAAQLISTLGCFLYAFLKYPELRLHREDWRITRRDVTRHLIQGIPLGLQFSVLAIGIIVMQSVIVQFDTLGGEMVSNAAQNGFGAANKINNLLMTPLNGLGAAMTSFTAQNLGAGDHARIKKGTVQALIIVWTMCLISIAAGLLLSRGGGYLYIFLSPDKVTAETMRYGNTYLYVDLSLYLFLGFIFVVRNCVQGIGKPQFVLGAGAAELAARVSVCLLLPPLIAGGAVNSDAPRAAVYALCFADPFAWMAADAVLLVPFLRNIMKMDYRYLKGTM